MTTKDTLSKRKDKYCDIHCDGRDFRYCKTYAWAGHLDDSNVDRVFSEKQINIVLKHSYQTSEGVV
jgi:hypothetical protein